MKRLQNQNFPFSYSAVSQNCNKFNMVGMVISGASIKYNVLMQNAFW